LSDTLRLTKTSMHSEKSVYHHETPTTTNSCDKNGLQNIRKHHAITLSSFLLLS